MKRPLILLMVLGALAIGAAAGSKFLDVRNDLAAQREAIAAQWEQVDAALERRADLIPGLADLLARMPKRESEAASDIAGDRAALARAHAPELKIQANQRLSADLARLLSMAEKYPKLRSDKRFLRLQDDLAGAENGIAVERRKYNEILEHYNAQIQRFPDNVVASLSGFRRNDNYFRTDGATHADPRGRF